MYVDYYCSIWYLYPMCYVDIDKYLAALSSVPFSQNYWSVIHETSLLYAPWFNTHLQTVTKYLCFPSKAHCVRWHKDFVQETFRVLSESVTACDALERRTVTSLEVLQSPEPLRPLLHTRNHVHASFRPCHTSIAAERIWDQLRIRRLVSSEVQVKSRRVRLYLYLLCFTQNRDQRNQSCVYKWKHTGHLDTPVQFDPIRKSTPLRLFVAIKTPKFDLTMGLPAVPLVVEQLIP